MKIRMLLQVAVLLALVGGCTEVRVLKVPTPTQYNQWDDDDQRRADGMEGFRFYLQRPFLAVYDPFPVHARSFLVDAVVDESGRYLVLRGNCTDPELSRVLQVCYGCQNIPCDSPVRLRGSGRPEGAEQPKTPKGRAEDAEVAKEKEEPKTDTPETPLFIQGMDQPGSRGVTDLSVTVDNNPYPTTPLRKHFDIVNLPDFDEQFAVRRTQGIGSASVDLTLGQGNLLQGFDAHLDNSSVANLMYGMLFTFSNALTGLGLNALGIPIPGGAEAADAKELVTKSGRAEGAELLKAPYSPVTLRVHIAYYATPGVYPIMKPRECKDWDRAVKWCNGLSTACRDDQGRIVLRMGPYAVPYNTFQYVLVEELTKGTAATTMVEKTRAVEQQPISTPVLTSLAVALNKEDSKLRKALDARKLTYLAHLQGPRIIVSVLRRDDSTDDLETAAKHDEVRLEIKGIVKEVAPGSNAAVSDRDIGVYFPATKDDRNRIVAEFKERMAREPILGFEGFDLLRIDMESATGYVAHIKGTAGGPARPADDVITTVERQLTSDILKKTQESNFKLPAALAERRDVGVKVAPL